MLIRWGMARLLATLGMTGYGVVVLGCVGISQPTVEKG